MKLERYKDLPEDIYDIFDEFTDVAYQLFLHQSTMDPFRCTKNVLIHRVNTFF